MEIIDNFLNTEDQDYLERLLFIEEHFPWYLAHTSNYTIHTYEDGIRENSGLPNEKEYHQFVHTFFAEEKSNSPFWKNIEKIFKSNKYVSINNFFRVKSNLNVQIRGATKDTHGVLHRDHFEDNYYTILYYVNDSDGDTLLFNKEKNVIKNIRPKKGRAILFDSNTFHAASPPLNYKFRIIINCICQK